VRPLHDFEKAGSASFAFCSLFVMNAMRSTSVALLNSLPLTEERVRGDPELVAEDVVAACVPFDEHRHLARRLLERHLEAGRRDDRVARQIADVLDALPRVDEGRGEVLRHRDEVLELARQ
jgi:hypothetical protein